MFSSFKKNKILIALALAGLFTFSLVSGAKADKLADIQEKNRQIEELQRQIDEYQSQIDQTHTKSKTLENEINKLNAKIGQIGLEIKSLAVSIDRTDLEIDTTSSKISEAEAKIQKYRDALAEFLKLTYESDNKNLAEIVLNHSTLSDFFNDLNSVQNTQDNIKLTIDQIKNLKVDLDGRKEELEDKRGELEKLKSLQELEKKSLDSGKSEKNKILKDTKGQESKYQELVKKTQADISALKDQIQYLQQAGVSVEDAVKYGQLVANRVGIRPAFLLGLLEVESRLGKNVGSGNWSDDMYLCYLRLADIATTNDRKIYYRKRAEDEKNAFFSVINKLGLDPGSVKVSKEPSYGCGGAMGPAQFIPTTWLGYEAQVMKLTGKSVVSPWNIEDAFTASAIKLAKGGATSKERVGEVAAAKAYISGNSQCTSSTCTGYANSVLRKADEIEPNLQ
jgi:peptidoglycan hydrolase CwlO-like protein